MKAVLFEKFRQIPSIAQIADPSPDPHGVVIKVEATGLCRSDWHGWMGHDSDISLPHVPGHEFAGTIAAVGSAVKLWKVGDRVTAPFICACGSCDHCHTGDQQVCKHQSQPGFTQFGSFAEFVAIKQADLNVVRLPDDMSFATAAGLGCRFATAFRAIVDQAQTRAGQWVAIHGCGGVGLSAIMIAKAMGAQVVAIDIDGQKLDYATQLGADFALDGSDADQLLPAILDVSKGGAHVSLDALGHPVTCYNSIDNLRPRGKHIQVGLMLADHASPKIPMAKVIAKELEILGSHGMQAHRYDAMLAMIESGKVDPNRLVGSQISLDEAPVALSEMDQFKSIGATVISRF